MKKIISLILGLALSISLLPSAFAQYSDIEQSAYYADSALRLQDLGIFNGYGDGTFRPDNQITRAEFTKTIVCMMDKDAEAAALSISTGFYDVPNGHWAAPYIRYATSQNILSGYGDGSFKPYQNISFAEALTILLRSIGYTEDSVGYFWPNNYLTTAAALGITSDMSCSADTPISRALAAVLIDRTMFAKPSGNQQNADTYIETIGYSVLDDALILDADTTSDNVSILAGNLKLGNAVTYISKTQMPIDTGNVYAHAVIDKNGYLVTVRDYDAGNGIYSETATINKLTDNTIEYTTLNGIKNTYKADDSFITYHDNTKMTFAQAKNYIKNGTDITFYGNIQGMWNIAVIGTNDDVDPVLASKNYQNTDAYLENTPINKENLIIYRDGKGATLSDIQANDVVYYNTKTNTMDVYSKKITGSYYAAYPSKAYVESVTVGGKSYEIGYSAATNRLDASYGAFDIGEKITLLLGKDDKIAFVTDNASSFDYFEYGVLLSNESRVASQGANDGSTEYIAKMFMPNGEVHDVVTDKLYKNNIGDFMRISYQNGVAFLTKQAASGVSSFAGKINLDDRTINGKYVLKDAAIIQRTSADNAASATCELIDFDNITSSNIDQGQIINVVTANKFGDIAIIYVKNFESVYDYGVITGFEKMATETVGYKIFSDGIQSSYMLGEYSGISTSVGEGVGFKLQNGTLSKIAALTKIAQANGVGAVEGSRIMLSGTIYKMASDVQIIDVTNTSAPRTLTIDELANLKAITSITLWSDKSLSSGGITRIITLKSN